MSISPGFTAAEVREFVHEYQLQPHGEKSSWLVAQGVSLSRLKRWRDAVYVGDLERGLVPREGSAMAIPPSKRTASERVRAAERDAEHAERARLQARIDELERTNDALGKAIGLLHAISGEEPDVTLTITDPSVSSPPSPPSSTN